MTKRVRSPQSADAERARKSLQDPPLSVRLTRFEMAVLDRIRGNLGRSAYARRVLLEHFTGVIHKEKSVDDDTGA